MPASENKGFRFGSQFAMNTGMKTTITREYGIWTVTDGEVTVKARGSKTGVMNLYRKERRERAEYVAGMFWADSRTGQVNYPRLDAGAWPDNPRNLWRDENGRPYDSDRVQSQMTLQETL